MRCNDCKCYCQICGNDYGKTNCCCIKGETIPIKVRNKFIDKIATILPRERFNKIEMAYYSKYDGSYIATVEKEKIIDIFFKKGITSEIQKVSDCGHIGFNPESKKWYGFFSLSSGGGFNEFSIGSTCKKEDRHYRAGTPEEVKNECVTFWNDYDNTKVYGSESIRKGKKGILIRDSKTRKTIHFHPYPEKYGKGEWIAQSLNDAKQMAIDFATGRL